MALLEYIPLIIFFIFYKTHDIFVATGALIVATVIQMIVLKLKKHPIPTRQWVVFGLVVGFGGLTIAFNDDAFLKWKVTIINGLFAATLLIGKYVFNKNLLQSFLGEQFQLPERVWTKFNLAWVCFFILCAVANWYVAFNFDQETWVNFKVFGLTAMTFVFAIASVMSVFKYLPKEDDTVTSVNKDEK
ncbi:septation protein A [Thalassotalea ponticola]|uniref:septation protein A n=1 Tax=Thalassotalea ponticola TaxID=1523392 RepID=UPI0025B33CB1|nr:septation protein A [Thalassotalea ponticola]MDN3651258.1 septation protein A [Thalassotalea ponticola]